MRCARYDRSGGETLTERHVQAIWYDRDIRPGALYTRAGEPLRVVYPGDWNLGAGPDFLNAVIEVGYGRRRMEGDVEVHLSPLDWEAHGHGKNPAYRNVILHVTWTTGPEAPSLPPGASSLWLGRFVVPQLGFEPERIDLGAYPFARIPEDARPCASRIAGSPDLAREVLFAAGSHRIRVKADRIARALAARPRERRQVFYEEVMHALGYKRNSWNFRAIAARVPFAALASEPENAEAALLAAAEFEDFNRLGIRPRNSPEARLSSAARIFTETDTASLADGGDFSKDGVKEMVRTMTAGGFLGRGRAAAVLANVVLPFALAEGRVRGTPDWLPAEDISEPVRLTAFRMFGRDHNPAAFYSKNDVMVQGLIQIHRDYCLQVHPDCCECALVDSILPATSKEESGPTPMTPV